MPATPGTTPSPKVSPNSPRNTPYDLTRQRETLRGWLAIWVLALLTATIVGLFILSACQLKDEATTFGQMVFTPMLTLASAVTGFYFASHRDQSPS